MDLLSRARSGEERALDELCRRYLPRLEHWASGRLPAYARGLLDTHDLVQEAVMATVARIDQFEPRHGGAFQAYLRTAVLNRLRNEIARARGRPAQAVLESCLVDPSPSPAEETIGREALERYERALDQLSTMERALVIARVEMGSSYAEIAEDTGKPSADAARMAVSRALVALAEQMRARERGTP
jgi:RNA polymerase sigma-70 factor (ECF subfamily)